MTWLSLLPFAVAVVVVVWLIRTCPHEHDVFERRDLHGVPAPHYVCEDCGRQVPVIRRAPSRHRRAYEMGQVRPFVVTRTAIRGERSGPAEVTAIRRSG